MKQITMNYQGKQEIFQVFCECKTNPAARGFFTRGFIDQNLIK